MTLPSIGHIVHYRLTADDADAINRRRDDTLRHLGEHRDRADGSQVHVGNPVNEGEQCPAMVVRTWQATTCNLQVFLDGNDIYWASSRDEGDEPGTWQWPLRM